MKIVLDRISASNLVSPSGERMITKSYYRPEEIAVMLSCSTRSILRAIKKGIIPCTKTSRKTFLISHSDVEKLKQKQVIRKYNKSSKPKLPKKIKPSLPDPKPELHPAPLPAPILPSSSQPEIAKPKKTNKSDSNNTKLMADVNEIVEAWNNTAKICKCRKVTNEIIKAAKKRLETYTLDEIKTIILNYQTILQDENTYFTYAWNLYEFLTRAKSFEYFNDDITVLSAKYRKFDADDHDESKDEDKWNWSFPQPKEWDKWSIEERKSYIKNNCIKETK